MSTASFRKVTKGNLPPPSAKSSAPDASADVHPSSDNDTEPPAEGLPQP